MKKNKEIFQKRHYEAVASKIRYDIENSPFLIGTRELRHWNISLHDTAEFLSKVFEEDNASFNKSRFLIATGITKIL